MAQDPTNGARRARCPEDVLAAIPWYAEGQLSPRQRGAVEAHAAVCRDCRDELDIVSGAPWAFDGIELPEAARLFGEIQARIDADARAESRLGQANVIPISRGRALSGEDLARIEEWVLDPASESELELESALAVEQAAREAADAAAEERSGAAVEAIRPGARRPRARFAASPLWAAAAAFVLVFLGGVAGRTLEQWRAADAASLAAADYRLASDGSGSIAASPAAPSIDVVFVDTVSARELSDALRGLGVEIVAGPSNLGVYRLRLLPAAVEGRAATAADVAAIAARLVAPGSPVAIFAEPVPSEQSP